jgi:hypothetical protein
MTFLSSLISNVISLILTSSLTITGATSTTFASFFLTSFGFLLNYANISPSSLSLSSLSSSYSSSSSSITSGALGTGAFFASTSVINAIVTLF